MTYIYLFGSRLAPFFLCYPNFKHILSTRKTNENMPRRGDICQDFNCTMLRFYRKKKYKTQKAFAKKMGVGIALVCRWENGYTKPTYKNLYKIADALGQPPRLFLVSSKRFIFDGFEDDVMEFVASPGGIVIETKEEILDETERRSVKKVERTIKLTEKGAIELAEKLGMFEDASKKSDEPDDRLEDFQA